MINQNWHSHNHKKYLLQVHLILVTKYCKKILTGALSELVKAMSIDILAKHDVAVKCMETDNDHIHYLLDMPTNISVEKIVKLLKSYTTYHVWRSIDLSNIYWNEHTLWIDGYFVCSVGDVSSSSLTRYIENQG